MGLDPLDLDDNTIDNNLNLDIAVRDARTNNFDEAHLGSGKVGLAVPPSRPADLVIHDERKIPWMLLMSLELLALLLHESASCLQIIRKFICDESLFLAFLNLEDQLGIGGLKLSAELLV